MRITIATSSISDAGAGVSAAVRSLACELSAQPGVKLEVVTLKDSREKVAVSLKVSITLCSRFGPRNIAFAPTFRNQLARSSPDVVHTHGIWQFPSAAVSRWEHSSRRPYLVSPHGMLDSWALQNSRWKKRLAALLYERRHLRNAACLHALNDAERRAIRAFGLTNPIAVIPNGVSLPSFEANRPNCHQKTVLFLGRLHQKKGLIPLMHAWAALGKRYWDDWRLAIAGWDDRGHEAEVRITAQRLGVTSTIDFLGPRFGDEKEQLLRQASAFVLPTFSEGLPMAVLEAWSYGLPVLMTPHCNLPEGFHRGAAVSAEPTQDSLQAGLRQMMEMSDVERQQMGAGGRALVEEQFTWPKVASKMREVYDWTLGGGAPPACVEMRP